MSRRVGVEIDAKENVSTASSTAAKSLRQLRAETEEIKNGVRNLLQPMINLRTAIVSLGAAAGLLQGMRAIGREIGEALQEFAKIDEDFASTMGNTGKAISAFKAEVGGLVAQIAGPMMQQLGGAFEFLARTLASARLVRDTMREATAGTLTLSIQTLDNRIAALRQAYAEQVKASRIPIAELPAARRVAFEDQLKAIEVLEKQREEAVKLYEATKAEMDSLIGGLKGTAAAAADVVETLDAVEVVRALIRGESSLGNVLSLEEKLATLRSWSFENEARYEEARLEAIKRLQEELDKLTGKIRGVIRSFDESEGDTFQLTTSEGDIYRAWAQSVFDANEGDRYDVVPSSGDEERSRLQSVFDANEGDTFAVAPPLSQVRSEKHLSKFNEKIQEAIDGIGGFVGGLMQSVATMGPLGLLYEALKPVLYGILEVLGPAIEGVLAPLFGALVVIGKLVGTLLAPVFELLGLVLDPVIEMFVGAYNFLLPVFNLLGKGLGYLAVGVDAVSRPFEWLGDLVTWVGAKLAYWIDSLPFIGTGKLSDPGKFISDAFSRPLIGNGWTDLTPIDTGTLTAEGVDYFEGTGGAFGGAYSGGSSGSGNTTVMKQPDINVYLTIEGSIYGAAGPREVGEEVARALEAYAGIGGRIKIEGALT